MSTKIGKVLHASKLHFLIGGYIALGVSSIALAETGTGETGSVVEDRTSISLHKIRGGRENATGVRETTEDYGPLMTVGNRSKATTRNGSSKSSPAGVEAQSASLDFWFYQADVILYNDDDNDGFYHGIDLLFDVDTNFLAADIYAVLYLSYEGGPWNEYAVSEDFTIYGTSGSDEYVLQTELMSGYLTGSYDLLIEVFDAYDSAFLASFGPDETSELGFLPLEDYNRDAPADVVVVHHYGGGGAIDQWLLGALVLLLMFSAAARIWRRRNDSLVRIDSDAPCWKAYADMQSKVQR
jgi:hypothetical protein